MTDMVCDKTENQNKQKILNSEQTITKHANAIMRKRLTSLECNIAIWIGVPLVSTCLEITRFPETLAKNVF